MVINNKKLKESVGSIVSGRYNSDHNMKEYVTLMHRWAQKEPRSFIVNIIFKESPKDAYGFEMMIYGTATEVNSQICESVGLCRTIVPREQAM